MRVPKIGRRLRRVGLLVGLVTVLAACGNDNGQNSLHPKGPYAQKIQNLFVPIVILAIVIGIGVLFATVFFALKFRYREGKADNPKQIHGSTPLEIGWTIVPALILAVRGTCPTSPTQCTPTCMPDASAAERSRQRSSASVSSTPMAGRRPTSGIRRSARSRQGRS